MVPMDAPGVEVRPLVNLLDKRWFNETVFENVRVPVSQRVGAENEGWRVLTSALGAERIPGYRAQAAMVKLFNTEFAQRLYQAGLGLLGPYGLLREGDPRAPINGSISHE